MFSGANASALVKKLAARKGISKIERYEHGVEKPQWFVSNSPEQSGDEVAVTVYSKGGRSAEITWWELWHAEQAR